MTSAKAWSRVMTWPRSPIRDLQIFDQSGQEDTKSEASSWCAPSPFFSAASAPQSVSVCLEVGRRLVECVAPQRRSVAWSSQVVMLMRLFMFQCVFELFYLTATCSLAIAQLSLPKRVPRNMSIVHYG